MREAFKIKKAIMNDMNCLYSLLFISLVCIGFSPFVKNGLSLIWNIDGIGQYYPAFLYIGKYIRELLRGLTHGEIVLPMYDLSIGMGEDIIGSLNYYGFGDPINLLAVFANQNNGAIIYAVVFFVRLYLSGISFIVYCKKIQIKTSGMLVGAVLYAFCGFAISGGMRYMEWLSVLFYFPLILTGVESILKDSKNVWLFVLSVFYAGLCGFYFLYMTSLILAMYCIVRITATYGIKHVVSKTLYLLGWYLVGIGIACPIVFPAVDAFLHSERNTQTLGWILQLWWWKPALGQVVNFIKSSLVPAAYNYAMGIVLVEWGGYSSGYFVLIQKEIYS